ncbi:MAG: phospho-sugar mutase [Epulopiscium sp.]|jgi:phosphoglucomutase|nr:phospho-sugar mutase [Candidatus Epulonipiscium sp.]
MDYRQRYEMWLSEDCFDDETKAELQAIRENDKEIQERFYTELEFGTGGLRGILGAGTNRMNVYTVGKATQGLANYILKQGTQEKGVAIAYDSRHMSKEFAEMAGRILAANHIKAYVFSELKPTPMLSFAVRHLQCTAGIVVTASHNPPEYNGYKVYWADGGQVTEPRDRDIIAEVNAVERYSDIRKMPLEEALAAGLFQWMDVSVEEAYIENVKAQCLQQDLIRAMADKVSIIYTPLHGAGNIPVRRALREVGFKNVFVVPEQELPDPDFTTVGYPNPEDPKVFTLAIQLAKEHDADILIATDPDSDRMGAVVKDNQGEYFVLSGNITGALLTEYVLSQKKAKGILPQNGAVVKTIVSTEIIRPIAKEYGMAMFEVLTGFKFIGRQMYEFERSGKYEYVFGFEESFGYLAGTYARDKDAVVATMLMCEMTAYYKSRGMTVYDGLLELYEKYGYYREKNIALVLKGLEGMEKIKNIMTHFRQNPPKDFNGIATAWARDYELQKFENILTGETEEDLLPVSNVLHYTLEDGSWVCIRPSGTEPKLKFYYGTVGDSIENADAKIDVLHKAMEAKLAQI